MSQCPKCGRRFSTLGTPEDFIPVHDCIGLELPFQTYERVTETRWPGGTNERIITLLRIFRITARPGSAEANLALQAKIIGQAVAA